MTGQIETTQQAARRPTRLRVRVIDHSESGEPAVDVSLPIPLVRFGLKMARTFSPELKDVDLDWETIAAAIETGDEGEIVHVEDEAKHQTVDVFLE